jgi:hypothetical protein
MVLVRPGHRAGGPRTVGEQPRPGRRAARTVPARAARLGMASPQTAARQVSAPVASRQRLVRLCHQSGRQADGLFGFRWFPLFLGPGHRAGTSPAHPRPRFALQVCGVQPGRRAGGLRRGRGGEGLGCEDVAAAPGVAGARRDDPWACLRPGRKAARLRPRRPRRGERLKQHLGRDGRPAPVHTARTGTLHHGPRPQPGRPAPGLGEWGSDREDVGCPHRQADPGPARGREIQGRRVQPGPCGGTRTGSWAWRSARTAIA